MNFWAFSSAKINFFPFIPKNTNGWVDKSLFIVIFGGYLHIFDSRLLFYPRGKFIGGKRKKEKCLSRDVHGFGFLFSNCLLFMN